MPAPATVACVLGSHRSGSSLTARVLNLLGVYLGPEEELMPAREDNNPRGFWEHQTISRLDEELLSRLSNLAPPLRQAWRDPPPLPPGWEDRSELADLRMRARALLESSFEEAPMWGFKDPRASLTLPFWAALIPRPCCVICVRNPVDVVASLERRDGITPAEGHRLWLVYTTMAILHTAGRARLLVSYERYFESWQSQLDRLARFLGVPERARRPEIQAAVAEHVDAGLWHHRTTLADTVDDPRVPLAVKSVYLALELAERLGAPEERAAGEALDGLARSILSQGGWESPGLAHRG